MAKRKRLSPASSAFLDATPDAASPLRAPIADVAREAAGNAAAEELAQTLVDARTQGRMVLPVPLGDIDLEYLVRDRVAIADDDMDALRQSIRARGQQTPVELVALEGGRYGLISGWRRCATLQQLHAETGEDRFTSVLGLLRQPAEHADAYLAMVEENEIRVGLSYFERARIVAKSVEQGVFDDDRSALRALFQSASRAKRSKIGSFLSVVRALDGALRFPQALGERQGLLLSRALNVDAALADRLGALLEKEAPETAEAEGMLLAQAISGPPKEKPATVQAKPTSKARSVTGGVRLTSAPGRIVLDGYAVTPALEAQLVAWLRNTV